LKISVFAFELSVLADQCQFFIMKSLDKFDLFLDHLLIVLHNALHSCAITAFSYVATVLVHFLFIMLFRCYLSQQKGYLLNLTYVTACR